jgi:hypothetical protein
MSESLQGILVAGAGIILGGIVASAVSSSSQNDQR